MNEKPGIHLITAEQARRFFIDVAKPLNSDMPIELEEPEHDQSDATECRLIIGSSIVVFYGSWEARYTLEELVQQSEERRMISNLFIG
jgi:hypothetical protein